MSTTMEAPRIYLAFDSFVALQQANLDLLETTAGVGADGPIQGPSVEQMRELIGRAVATGTILDRPAERKAAQAAIDYWTTSLILAHSPSDVSLGERVKSSEILQTLAPLDIGRLPEIKNEAAPFKGLEPFETADQDKFFGRGDVKAELAKRVQGQSFVLLLGPSGSGKSSLVNAGLIPDLQRNPDAYRIIRVPQLGRRPITAILRAILPDAPSEQRDGHEKAIIKSPGKLAELLQSSSSLPTILIIDQTGEALSRSDIEPSLEILGKALASCVAVVKLLICLRESQRQQFENISGVGEYAKSPANCFVLPPPTAQELRSMIEGPAVRVGLQFEEGVVEDIVKTLVGNPDALPLLQFTLERLWASRQRNTITHDVYRALGAPRLAVRNAADKVYEGLSPDGQKVASHIFDRLLLPSGERGFIRARLSRDALAVNEKQESVDRVLDAFVRAGILRKILSRDADRFEIAFESVVTEWQTLANWLSNRRQSEEKEAKLSSMARLWLDSNRGSGYLISGRVLEELKNYNGDSSDVRAFINASRKTEGRKKLIYAAVGCGVPLLLFVAGIYAYEQDNLLKIQEQLAVQQNINLEGQKKLRDEYSEKLASSRNTANALDSILRAIDNRNLDDIKAILKRSGISDKTINDVFRDKPLNTTGLSESIAQVVEPTQQLQAPAPPPVPVPQFDSASGDCIGFMWFGSRDNWKLRTPDSPDKLQVGPAIANTNVLLRSGYPTDPPAYIMQPSYGYVPDGTLFKVLEKHKPFDRPTGQQVWAKVQVPRKICAKVYIQYAGSQDTAFKMRTALIADKYQVIDAPEKIDLAAGISEIRYFNADDQKLAQELANKVSDLAGNKPVQLRPLLNFAAKKPPPGQLEVWIDLPASPT